MFYSKYKNVFLVIVFDERVIFFYFVKIRLLMFLNVKCSDMVNIVFLEYELRDIKFFYLIFGFFIVFIGICYGFLICMFCNVVGFLIYLIFVYIFYWE